MAEAEFTFETVSDLAPTCEAEADYDSIVASLKNSAAFFIDFFIHEELDHEVPPIHVSIWEDMTDTTKERKLLAIPREHAKTTLAKLAVVWYWLFTGHRFCAYLSNTSPIAKNACRDIVNYLRSPNFVSVFGEPVFHKESEVEGLWIFTLQMPGGGEKKCILRATGANQQMRGINIDNQRPDIAVIDDLEDKANTASAQLQKNLDEWVFGTFIKALARKRLKLIWLGNMLRKTTLLARLSQRPNWNPTVYGCLIKDESNKLVPLWPDLWTIEKIMEDFSEYRDLGLVETWMCEMMNMPGRGANGFSIDQINYQPMPVPEELAGAFITIDPAFGQNVQEHDSTAIVVHGIRKNGCPMVVGYEVGHMDDREMFDRALALSEYWRAYTWGIESVAAQRLLKSLFSMYATAAGCGHVLEFVDLKAGMDKHSRIKAWVASMDPRGVGGKPRDPTYGVFENDWSITQQLLDYDLTKKDQEDDLCDSCAYGIQMMENYLPLIYAQFNGGLDRGTIPPQLGSEICSV